MLSEAVMRTGYRGLSKGSKWGFTAAMLVGAPLFLFLIWVDALGDCEPNTSCRHGFLPMVLLPTLLVTIPIFLTIRYAINRGSQHEL
jgi:hypothetical protein